LKTDVVNAVKTALMLIIVNIDCAMLYNNSEEIDRAIGSCEESIKNLELEYLDLYLIHWPDCFHCSDGAGFDLNGSKTCLRVSKNRRHQESNEKVGSSRTGKVSLDFELTKEEMDKLDGADMNKRLFEVPA
uniref:Aldo_ket_red domain-containing protein n=1 Tax=Hymenolepis diminuta TaxID=6216 RepID=A0A0R3SU12_HYMDI